jgi:hypothetical protein
MFALIHVLQTFQKSEGLPSFKPQDFYQEEDPILAFSKQIQYLQQQRQILLNVQQLVDLMSLNSSIFAIHLPVLQI